MKNCGKTRNNTKRNLFQTTLYKNYNHNFKTFTFHVKNVPLYEKNRWKEKYYSINNTFANEILGNICNFFLVICFLYPWMKTKKYYFAYKVIMIIIFSCKISMFPLKKSDNEFLKKCLILPFVQISGKTISSVLVNILFKSKHSDRKVVYLQVWKFKYCSRFWSMAKKKIRLWEQIVTPLHIKINPLYTDLTKTRFDKLLTVENIENNLVYKQHQSVFIALSGAIISLE